MINVIIPPILIILIIALLITIFARAVRNMPTEDDVRSRTRMPDESDEEEEKRGRLRSTFSEHFSRLSLFVKSLAYRRNKKAKMQMSSMDKLEEESYDDSHTRLQKSVKMMQQHKLSRMGELILSHHKGGAENDAAESAQDIQEAYFVKQIEANPKNPDTYQQLGDYYMEMHKFEDARESYKYVLRIDPRHKKAQEAMKSLDRVLG